MDVAVHIAEKGALVTVRKAKNDAGVVEGGCGPGYRADYVLWD